MIFKHAVVRSRTIFLPPFWAFGPDWRDLKVVPLRVTTFSQSSLLFCGTSKPSYRNFQDYLRHHGGHVSRPMDARCGDLEIGGSQAYVTTRLRLSGVYVPFRGGGFPPSSIVIPIPQYHLPTEREKNWHHRRRVMLPTFPC
jgi:hypothetical protein